MKDDGWGQGQGWGTPSSGLRAKYVYLAGVACRKSQSDEGSDQWHKHMVHCSSSLKENVSESDPDQSPIYSLGMVHRLRLFFPTICIDSRQCSHVDQTKIAIPPPPPLPKI